MFRIPTITKNLLIINFIVFLATTVLQTRGINLANIGGLHFFLAKDFHFYQLVTYLFLHANMSHIFFNMLALWMFGCMVENEWGSKKFLFYYICCGIGAGLCQEIVQFISFYMTYKEQIPSIGLGDLIFLGKSFSVLLNSWTTIGASGAVYAVLLAFGMIFPKRLIGVPLAIIAFIVLDLVNTNAIIESALSWMNNIFILAIIFAIISPYNPLSPKIWRLLFTRPIEARWCVLGYIALEILYTWKNVEGDNVAHMAHLGGVLFGFLMIRYWNRHPDSNFNNSRGREFFENLKRNFDQRQQQKNNSNPHMHAERGGSKQDDMEYNARKRQNQEEIDAILDKIRKSGYDSLTKEEKQKLFEASKQ